jgi:nucleoside-triphosphatase
VAATLNLLITGRPGIGKTTVVERLVALLPPGAATGFFTREVREGGVRRGFAIRTLDGRSATLARAGGGNGPVVGRYRVRLDAIDRVAVPALAPTPGVRIVVVDEIGRMECLSDAFCAGVRAALDGPAAVVGTIARGGGGFIAEVRARSDVTIVELTVENRADLPAEIAARIRTPR